MHTALHKFPNIISLHCITAYIQSAPTNSQLVMDKLGVTAIQLLILYSINAHHCINSCCIIASGYSSQEYYQFDISVKVDKN